MKRCDSIIQDQLNDGVVEEVDKDSCNELTTFPSYRYQTIKGDSKL